MTKSSPEYVADFLLEFLPDLLPKPADSAVKSVIGVFREQLDNALKQPRLRRELLEAAQNAESDFRAKAIEQLKNDELTQAIASFPLFDRDLFQAALQSLPEHLNEEYLATHLRTYISNDWSGKFTSAELREGVAIYLNCLRLQLLKVDGFADVVVRLATLRTDQNVEHIQASVDELKQLIKLLVNQGAFSQLTTYSLFTIPPPVADFTGREAELAQLTESFEKGAIITGVSGGGGVGKTELARTLAQEIAGNFPDARLSIDLLGTSKTPLAFEEVMRRILEPFYPNQKLPDEPEQLKGLYQQTFSAHTALLLLDNAADAKQVRPLIPPAPSAAIITSRRHFSLTEFGLSEPLQLDVLSLAEACNLLRSASPKLRTAPDTEVDTLAALCGKLPLALRVAASILNDRADWTPASLLKRLGDERTRLQRLKRTDDIDLNVESTLSLSYTLLDDEGKKRFRQLGAFTAPFIRDSAQAVWQMNDENEADDLIGKFTALSLLNILPAPFTKGDETLSLYALHDLTRLFAMTQLLEDEDEAQQAVLRHAVHYLEWANAADDLYEKGNENILHGLAQFRFIWAHLDSAYERMVSEHSRLPEADAWLSHFPGWCAYVLDLHVSPRRRISVLETALNAARRLEDKGAEGEHLGSLGNAYAALGDARKAIEFYEQHLSIAREMGDRRSEGADLCNLGIVYADLGDARKAITFYEQALVIDREIGDRRAEGAILGNLGIAYKNLGDARKAITFYEQALVIDREIGDRRGEGADLGNLGNAYFSLGDAHKAIEYHEKYLSIAREIGDRRGEGNALANLGVAYADLGNVRKAIEFYEQALVIDREIDDRRGEGADLGNLGSAYADLGDARKAIEYHEQALVIDREIGDRRGEGADLGNLGIAYKNLGDVRKAIEFYEQALVIDREIGDRRSEGTAFGNLGSAHADLGNVRKAIEYHEQALVIDREIGDRRGEGADLGNLGNAHATLGDARKAIKFYERQLVIVREIGDRRGEGNAFANLGLVYKSLGEKEKAENVWREALEIYRAIESPHVARVEEWLADLDNNK